MQGKGTEVDLLCCQKVEHIAGPRGFSAPVELGIAADCAGNGRETPVLDVEKTGKAGTRGADLIGFSFFVATLGALVTFCCHDMCLCLSTGFTGGY